MSENSVTLSVPGHSVTINESDFASTVETARPQKLYESVISCRMQVSMARKSRADALKNDARWSTIKADMKSMGKEKKTIEISFDQEHPEFKTAIDYSGDMLSSVETQLGILALDAYRYGSPLQLVRTGKNGKQKKIEIRYKVQYHQLSLFS